MTAVVMTQTFSRRAELAVKLALGTFLALASTVAVWLVGLGRHGTGMDAPVAQPVPFSHKHHVGDVGLDCRYCHTSVEAGASDGLKKQLPRRDSDTQL